MAIHDGTARSASLATTAARGAMVICAVALGAGACTALLFTRALLSRQALDELRESHRRAARVASEALSEQRDAVFLGYAQTWVGEGTAVEAVVVSPDGRVYLHSDMLRSVPAAAVDAYHDAAWALASRGGGDVSLKESGDSLSAACRLRPPHEEYALAARYDRASVFRWRDEALRGLAVRLAGGGVVLLGLALLGARRFGDGIAAPARCLLEGARHLGTRLDPVPLLPQGPRELRELAGELNALADRLRMSREALDLLLKGAAHDMRGPLSVLLSSAEELEAEGAPATEPVRRVKMAVESLRVLVDDLLDAALVREGRGLRLAAVDAAEVVRRTGDFYFSEGNARRVKLETDLPAELSPVKADAAALERVLGNLLVNALRFTPRGGLIILRLEPDGHRVRFTVSDTGQGMDSAQAGRLGSGSSERDAARPAARHLGLGLPICRALVEGMGGRLGISSVPGKGTSVVFSLPCTDG